MIEQAIDFRDESAALHRILEPLEEADFDRETLFKDWTINDILGHLHLWNIAADLSLTDEAGLMKLMSRFDETTKKGASINEAEREQLGGLRGQTLLALWREYLQSMAKRFHAADPRKRVLWGSVRMSARSSITARLMETWSHGQAIYDVLGLERVHTDRVKNIAILGVHTYGFSYTNRGQDPPGRIPLVRLTAPSGEVWTLTEPNETDRIEGDAVEFCQVVTQCRSVWDTSLEVVGEVAKGWMAIAQCFAGKPENPPAPGQRHTA